MIQILNDSIINKIAAGGVIERPANVVKELLENSFDAGADEIKIEIIDAGLKKIRISDNGEGMSRADALLSFKRHATSKIESENDLFNISSLGFRGEALASIAEVSNLKIITKTEDSVLGTYIEVEAGQLIKSDVIGCNKGTIIEVNDLFFNVPARKKYLKSDDIELNHIIKIVTKYALIKKDISIRLIHNNKELINSQKTDSLLNNIIFIYGPEIAKNLVEVSYEEEGVLVKGYISKPSLTRADRSEQSLYLNDRYVRDGIISDAIYNAYKTLLFINRHPVFVINISLAPNEVDVNVHPTKTNIRLKNEELVAGVVHNAIRNAFQTNLVPEVSVEKESSNIPVKQYEFQTDRQSSLPIKPASPEGNVKEQNLEYPEKKEETRVVEKIGPLYILGQVNKTYIIAENKNSLVIIDQHAAEERVNYERFMTELKEKAIKKQYLLQPRIVELNRVQYNAANQNKEFLTKIGFEFEDFGDRTIKLTAVPEIFGRLKSVLFIDILNELVSLKDKILNREIEERIIRFSCRASVKAGDEMTMPQMKQLFERLEQCENPYTCPHGRPTIISFNIADLEKKFKRTGW
jgi:DNA mismatch repair protein MutL